MVNSIVCSGYLAPEYAMSGHLTEKADVFAFGIVALEVVSGRPPTDMTLEEENRYLLEWVQTMKENLIELILHFRPFLSLQFVH